MFSLLSKGTLKSLLQHHHSKASILWHSAYFMVQLLHPYITSGTTIALTKWTFVGHVMCLLFNMLSRFVIAFLPRSKHLLISWLPSPYAVILEPKKISRLSVLSLQIINVTQISKDREVRKWSKTSRRNLWTLIDIYQ